jgi:glycosyltransferase involved in cell wall biosynthesis
MTDATATPPVLAPAGSSAVPTGKRTRRLLSIAHSYVVALNRRLAHEMARAGGGAWEVTAVAPRFVHGDLRPIALEPHPDDQLISLHPLPFRLSRRIHVAFYGLGLRALLAGPWDLIHCWEEPYVVAGAQVAALAPRGRPFVFWTAQNIAKRYPPPFNWLERFCLGRCAGWMACGRSVLDALLPRGYDARPHRVLPLGVDVERFRPDPEAGRAVRRTLGWDGEGPPVVGYLGRFVPEKGIDQLTRVLDRLPCPWRALFVGGGPLEPTLRAWAARHGDRVRLCTDVTHDRVPAYLNAMDALAAPSQTTPRWREQFGRMTVEAFACGVPFVGSDSGEIPHVVGGDGVIAGERDEAAWERALAVLLQDPARRRELGLRGLERARADYAWPVIARRYLDFFEEVLDRRAAAADSSLVGGWQRGRETNFPKV